MAKELERKISSAYIIREGNANADGSYGDILSGSFGSEYGNVYGGIVNTQSNAVNLLSEGEIAITQYVTVSFYIK